jgi:hypothetical protein
LATSCKSTLLTMSNEFSDAMCVYSLLESRMLMHAPLY